MEGEIDLSVTGISTPCKTCYKVIGDFKTSSPSSRYTTGPPQSATTFFLSLTLPTCTGFPSSSYDQLGNGRSTHLRGDYDLLGHSQGGMLGALQILLSLTW